MCQYLRGTHIFCSGVHINNFSETSEVHRPRFSALLALTCGPRRSTGNLLAVCILDRGLHFEYPCSI